MITRRQWVNFKDGVKGWAVLTACLLLFLLFIFGEALLWVGVPFLLFLLLLKLLGWIL